MEQSDIDKLLALRSAWDKFKSKSKADKLAKDYDDYYMVVWTYGMERRDEIEKFNDEMVMQLLQEYRSVHGECDLCKGLAGDPQCKSLWGSKACGVTGIPVKLDMVSTYDYLFTGIRNYVLKIKQYEESKTPQSERLAEWNKNHTVYIWDDKLSFICPPGHGYYHDYKVKDKDFPFDILWIP
jgi:hypothetical protein